MLSNALCIFHMYSAADVSAAQHHLFSCLLISISPAPAMLCMLLMCGYLFLLIHEAYSPVVSVVIINYSTRMLATSTDFSQYAILVNSHVYTCFFSLLNVVRMNQIIMTGDRLDAVWNIRSVLIFTHTIVGMEVNPWILFTL